MTTPSHHPDRRRARELDPVDDVTKEFWGPGADWPTNEQPVVDSARHEENGLGATVRRWWNTTGPVPATRSHRTHDATSAATVSDDDTDELGLDDWLDASFAEWSTDADRSGVAGTSRSRTRENVDPDPDDWSSSDWRREHELDDGLFSDEFDHHHELLGAASDGDDRPNAPVAPPRGGVDPLLARLGGLAVIVTLLVPIVLGFSSGSDDDDALRTAASPPAASADPSSETPAASTAATPTAPAAPAAASTATTAETSVDETATIVTTTVAEPASTSTEAAAAAATRTEQLTVDTCALEYEVVAGDFWIRIADGSGVALADVLAANDATVATPLFPGSAICLPAGATTPPAPATPSTTGAAPTTSATAPTPTRPPVTAPPATTPPPPPVTTAPPPPASNASAAEVQAIIRAVWPDELEARALQVAWRESNYIPTAKNFCCYGVFQIYWSVHRGWLADMGVTSAEQLYDPTVNARAALVLYQRSGGWGPWGG